MCVCVCVCAVCVCVYVCVYTRECIALFALLYIEYFVKKCHTIYIYYKASVIKLLVLPMLLLSLMKRPEEE